MSNGHVMASPYPRLSFDRTDRCLLTSVALTASVVATLMGILAWTSPPPAGVHQDPPSFVRWMQLLGTPKNLRHARVLTMVPMTSDEPSDSALTSLSWDITSSPCAVSCWAPRRLPRMCFSYEPPVPDHARDLFGPVLLASEVAAAVTRPEAVPRVRVGRVTTAISDAAVLPVRRRAERSRSQQHGRATLTVSVSATGPRR